ncbi:beta-eliminating lyase-related protein [Mesorhizobium sp.]|uniref:threonine aldolase family protein n=1 Tax=Mesorhizobium sp. TaxID=1871066 RepID=UPI0025C6E82C|nr:beta-eliminating lyase-related protein [Mesorhizobium sp.]
MASFLSDNTAGVHPAIMEAIAAANEGDALPYGDDALSSRLDAAFSEIFEKEVAVIPCVSGTAANALALALVAGPTNAICAHVDSHVYGDECNAPEFFTGGARLTPVQGASGKLERGALQPAVERSGGRHAAQPCAISIAQATEAGTLYSLNELENLCIFARERNLFLHMDGARFANAVAALGCHPAEMTWKVGMNVLSFGATKNGCLAAEAVVLFDPQLAGEARFRAKRAGLLLSKMRFLSAQLLAYLKDDLWLTCARDANVAARKLHDILANHPKVRVQGIPEANILFAYMPLELTEKLEQAGLAGYGGGGGLMRLCTSWSTGSDELDRLRTLIDSDNAARAKGF